MKADQVDRAWYDRDRALLTQFLREIHKNAPKAEIVYLEGNHEERYRRLMSKYPNQFKGDAHLRLYPEAVPDGLKVKWIPYGNYDSWYKVGDMIFTHGTIYPDAHSQKYALNYAPNKVVYGHLHDFQAFSIRTAMADSKASRYALTSGCLTHRAPDYKKGAPNKWVNGFQSFTCINGVTIPEPHIIENGWFSVGGKVYRAAA